MKTKKIRIETITETEREITFRMTRRRAFLGVSCGACAGEMISINEAAATVGVVWREIVRLIETGAVHSTETSHGEIFLCAASLKKMPV